MYTLKMSLRNKASNHQESEAAQQHIFQNTGVKRLNSFKTDVKGVLFSMTDHDNCPGNPFKFYSLK